MNKLVSRLTVQFTKRSTEDLMKIRMDYVGNESVTGVIDEIINDRNKAIFAMWDE